MAADIQRLKILKLEDQRSDRDLEDQITFKITLLLLVKELF